MGLGSQTAQIPIGNRRLISCMTLVKFPELFGLLDSFIPRGLIKVVIVQGCCKGKGASCLKAPSTVPAKEEALNKCVYQAHEPPHELPRVER